MRILLIAILLISYSVIVSAQEPTVDRQPTNELDAPLTVLYKPKATYPVPETGAICMQGNVTLRVTFRFDGTVGTITTIKGLPHGATENAIEAARQIQFLPEISNGYYVNTTLPVSFSFSIY
jgi:TonB family protein